MPLGEWLAGQRSNPIVHAWDYITRPCLGVALQAHLSLQEADCRRATAAESLNQQTKLPATPQQKHRIHTYINRRAHAPSRRKRGADRRRAAAAGNSCTLVQTHNHTTDTHETEYTHPAASSEELTAAAPLPLEGAALTSSQTRTHHQMHTPFTEYMHTPAAGSEELAAAAPPPLEGFGHLADGSTHE